MRVWKLLLLLCLAGGAFAEGRMPPEEFRARRASLRKSLDGAVVLFSHVEGPDEVYELAEEPNFYYLTGWEQPGAILLITPSDDILFLPHHNERRERFVGHRTSAEDANAREITGFDRVMPIEKFEAQLAAAANNAEKLYALPRSRAASRLEALYPFRQIADASGPVTKLRVKKSPAEISALRHASDVSIEAHRAAWKRIAGGVYEHQVAATLMGTYLENGCEGPAYTPIVGAGPNGVILHYTAGNRRMDSGQVVVIDAAAECNHYASDITRSLPVGGKFTPRQRELYEIVLGAQKAAIAAVKPGAILKGNEAGLGKIAFDYINTHGKDLHGQPLGKYFLHGLGHQVGIDVHDPSTASGSLEAGMVITIEPGIYIAEEGIGIRIEDVLLVTENGAEILSAALPREPDEVEKALAR